MDKNEIPKAATLFDKYAQEYQEAYMDVSMFSDALNEFCQRLNNPLAKILDIACGPGNIVQFLLSHYPHYNIIGTDLAPKMIALAKKNNPQAEFIEMNACELNFIPQTFHGILSSFLVPYLNEEQVDKLLADAHDLLLANGVFYLSCIEGDVEESGLKSSSLNEEDQLFIYQYRAKNLAKKMSSHGFRNININYQTIQASGSEIEIAILICEK